MRLFWALTGVIAASLVAVADAHPEATPASVEVVVQAPPGCEWIAAAITGPSAAKADTPVALPPPRPTLRCLGRGSDWRFMSVDSRFGPLSISLAARGDTHAMADYGYFLITGGKGLTDRAVGLDLLHRAASAGEPHAMVGLGIAYEHGLAVKRDTVEARDWYRKAAEMGSAEGHGQLGYMLFVGSGGSRDVPAAVTELRAGAEGGDPRAMIYLAFAYRAGVGVAPDLAQTRAWTLKAASLGDASAMVDMAFLCERGEGGPVDQAQAVAWFLAGAVHGDPRAMMIVSDLYRVGNGVPKDDATALYWLERAGEREDLSALSELVSLYKTGAGSIAADPAKAGLWTARATRTKLRSTAPWARKPTGNELARYYPPRANRLEVSGTTLLACTAQADGSVADCEVKFEDPLGYGFGNAALHAATLFRLRLDLGSEGPAVGEEVDIPIAFGHR